jgi:hypothetical protein
MNGTKLYSLSPRTTSYSPMPGAVKSAAGPREVMSAQQHRELQDNHNAQIQRMQTSKNKCVEV